MNSQVSRKDVVRIIRHFRLQWQEAASGDLVVTPASVGLLLGDLARAFEFTPTEKRIALGSRLVSQIESVCDSLPVVQ